MTKPKATTAAGAIVALVLVVPIIGCSSAPTFPRPEFALRRPSPELPAATTPVAAVAPAPAAAPPNTTEPPAVAGSRLHTVESETATQRALELTRKLGEAEAERSRLTARIERLEAGGVAKDQELEQAKLEIQSARAEMARARDELERWKQEIVTLRDKLRGADEENLHTLQTAVSLLQQILSQGDEHDSSGAAASGHATSD